MHGPSGFLELLTSLDVIELRLGGGIILWRWGGFQAYPRLDGGSEQGTGLVGANRLLLDPGLDLAAALSPKTPKICHFKKLLTFFESKKLPQI